METGVDDDDAAGIADCGGLLCEVLSSVINGLSISMTSTCCSCGGFDAAGGAADEEEEGDAGFAAWEEAIEVLWDALLVDAGTCGVDSLLGCAKSDEL